MAVISNAKVRVQQQLKKFKSVFSRHKNLPSSLLPKITRYVRWELLCTPKNFGPRSWLSCHEARKRFLSHHIEDNKLPLNSRTYKTLKHILFEVFWNDKMEAMIIILFFFTCSWCVASCVCHISSCFQWRRCLWWSTGTACGKSRDSDEALRASAWTKCCSRIGKVVKIDCLVSSYYTHL